MKDEIISRAFCPFCNKGVAVQILSHVGEGKATIKWIIVIVILALLFLSFKFGWNTAGAKFLASFLSLEAENTSLLLIFAPYLVTAFVGGAIGYIMTMLDDDLPLRYQCKECEATLNDGIWSKRLKRNETN